MKIFNLVLILGVLPCLFASESESERSLSRQKKALIYPQYTVLQLTMCIISQISSLTSHRVAINAGFNINYNLPFQLSDFYSPLYWARSLSNTSSPFTNFFEKLARSDDSEEIESNEDGYDDKRNEEQEESEEYMNDETTTEISTSTKKTGRKHKAMMKRDLSAGEFYYGIRELMTYSGYHEECLLKSVCELARHPLHEDEDNFAHDLMNFILTPSIHQAFDSENEAYEKQLFEEAEEIGKSGGDCEFYYGANCDVSPLHKISKFMHHDSNDI